MGTYPSTTGVYMINTPKQQKIIHIILTNTEGKWKSINLSNLVPELTVGQAQDVFDHVWPLLVTKAEARLAHLQELKAPPIILNGDIKLVAKVKRKVHPSLAALKKRIKQ